MPVETSCWHLVFTARGCWLDTWVLMLEKEAFLPKEPFCQHTLCFETGSLPLTRDSLVQPREHHGSARPASPAQVLGIPMRVTNTQPPSLCHLPFTRTVQPRSEGLWFPAGSQFVIHPGPGKDTARCDLLHTLGTGGGAEARAAKLVVSFELFNHSMLSLYQGLTSRAGMFEGFLSAPRVHLPAFSLICPLFAHAPASLHTRRGGAGGREDGWPAATELSLPLWIPRDQIPHLGVYSTWSLHFSRSFSLLPFLPACLPYFL